MNGYSTAIFEKNSDCGGVSYAWKRGDYTFDGASNWLAGSSPASSMHNLLSELLDFSQLEIIDPDIFITVEYQQSTFNVFCDAEKLRGEMLRIAPEDFRIIKKFTDAIKTAGTVSLPYSKPPELFNLWDYCTFLFSQSSFIRFFLKWKRVTIKKLSMEFKNKTLRELFLRIFPRHEHFSVMSVILTLGWMNIKSGGYPVGGSNKLIELLVKKYLASGGKLHLHTEVTAINVENNKVTGIRLKNGDAISADKVIVATDLQYTVRHLLSGQKITSELAHKCDTFPVFPALFQISLGVKRTFTALPHKISMALNETIDMGEGGIFSEMMVRVCHFDPTLSRPGTTSIIVQIRIPQYQYWVDLRNSNYSRYTEEKKLIAEMVISSLEKRFGSIRSVIENIDIATPATFMRYTNIFKGSYQGWAPVPSMIGKTLPKTLNPVRDLYVTGQWVWAAGGIPGVIRIARHTAQIICHNDKRKFRVREI
jgi:phytoene dehydrogenase-like protein